MINKNSGKTIHKCVLLQKPVYDRLRQYGKTPESFNTVLSRILDFYEIYQQELQREQQQNNNINYKHDMETEIVS